MAWLILIALNKTVRFHRIVINENKEVFNSKRSLIFVLWHEAQLSTSCSYLALRERLEADGSKAPPFCALISGHSDGQIIAKAIKCFGLDAIPGSSTRGGTEATLKLVDLLEKGRHVVITPDGPRGPRHKAKIGVVKIASLSGVRIHPLGIAVDRKWTAKSWDKMYLPKPFSNVVAIWDGEGIVVPPDLSKEELLRYATMVEERLQSVTEEAARYLKEKVNV